MFLLDTDHLAVLQQRRPKKEYENLSRRMARFGLDDFAISVVTIHEQMLGANAYISRANDRRGVLRGYAMMERTLQDAAHFLVLPFDEATLLEFESQRHAGVRIATMDLRIGCIGVSRQLTVLTRNLADFQAVAGLSTEDWTCPA
jgi:tRNA(fMet)-specific endonuclease VapC